VCGIVPVNQVFLRNEMSLLVDKAYSSVQCESSEKRRALAHG